MPRRKSILFYFNKEILFNHFVSSMLRVISWEGLKDNGWTGFSDIMELNFWPESLSAASSWFGVVVFGYGVVPFIFTFRDSMAKPSCICLSTKIGLSIAYVFYLFASNGIRILFLHTHSFDGDVLQALPDSSVSLVVRLLMIFVVTVTAPLVAVPVRIFGVLSASIYNPLLFDTLFF
jgi:hypothetical protein